MIDWAEFQRVNSLYLATAGKALNIGDFNQIAITAHSTRIEGSTLTLNEASLLIKDGISTGGKEHYFHDMVIDHHEALKFVLAAAEQKRGIDPPFIKEIASHVMHRTGREVHSVLGTTQETSGDFRKVNVTAGSSYFMNYDKVPVSVDVLTESLQERIIKVSTVEEIHSLAFSAHFDLVNIHPFTDGNGRVSRLLMNYIQAYHGQPLTVVKAESKVQYIEALERTRKEESIGPIIEFLALQHTDWLNNLQQKFDLAMKQTELKKRPGMDMPLSLFF
ncbi:MAG: Fic family protein [Bacteroidota bacterium]